MPNYTFEKADGTKVDIEAATEAKAKASATKNYGIEFKKKPKAPEPR